ncbi:MAG: hypothetical protein NTW19_19910 [Planctomycetota bacterium]|nr:hypothetical protein [Planctomycetota bacterium]
MYRLMTLVTVALCAAAGGCCADKSATRSKEPSPSQILRDVGKAYVALETYSCWAAFIVNADEERSGTLMLNSFYTAIDRPEKLFRTGLESPHALIVRDNRAQYATDELPTRLLDIPAPNPLTCASLNHIVSACQPRAGMTNVLLPLDAALLLDGSLGSMFSAARPTAIPRSDPQYARLVEAFNSASAGHLYRLPKDPVPPALVPPLLVRLEFKQGAADLAFDSATHLLRVAFIRTDASWFGVPGGRRLNCAYIVFKVESSKPDPSAWKFRQLDSDQNPVPVSSVEAFAKMLQERANKEQEQ